MTNSMHATPEAALAWELAAITTLDELIRSAQAEQYRRIETARQWAAALENVTEASAPSEQSMATRSFVAELATTLVVHEATAGRLVYESARLTGPRRATLEALEAGTMSITQVRSVLELTHDVPGEVANQVERVAVRNAPTTANGQLRRQLRRERERLHPEPLSVRRERAAEERRVCLDPAADGMAWVSLFLEAERATAIERRLGVLAERADDQVPDDRTTAQRAADIAADLLLAGSLGSDARTGTAATGGVVPRINVTVPVMTLLGLSDEPADLEGHGPIDADTARRLTAHAPSLRRILVHPETGACLSYGRDTYRVPADLAGYIRLRDGQCRFPGCNRPAEKTDLDHTDSWGCDDGCTDENNLACLCRGHHRLKHESGWQVHNEGAGVLRWTSPAGHVLRTLPERPFTPVVGGAPPASATAPDAPQPDAPPPDAPPPDSAPESPHDEDPPWAHASAA